MNTSLLINDLISVLENVNKKHTETEDDKIISKIENNPIIKDLSNVLNKNFEDFITNNNQLTSNLNNAVSLREQQDNLANNGNTSNISNIDNTSNTSNITNTSNTSNTSDTSDDSEKSKDEEDIMGRFKWVLIGIGIFIFLIICGSLIYYYYSSYFKILFSLIIMTFINSLINYFLFILEILFYEKINSIHQEVISKEI